MSTHFPQTWAELGENLRQARGEQSLRALAQQVFISKSALQRYESGGEVPETAAAQLDAFYDTEGWISIAVTRLTLTSWSPWRRQPPSRFRSYRWPAAFDGMVWLELRPAGDDEASMTVDLAWGPWRRRWSGAVPVAGVILWTDKSPDEDGIAVPLRVTLDRDAYVRFGANEVNDDRFNDVSTGWTKTPSEA